MPENTKPDQVDILAENERLTAELSALTTERDTLKTENQTLKAENTSLKAKEADFNKSVAGQVVKLGIDGAAKTETSTAETKKLSATEKVLKAKGAASLAELAAKK